VSLDVQVAEDWYAKRQRSYFVWEFGKAPELALEIVSNREGDELGRKRYLYARIEVLY
jgi:Uma2 family endonuclease